MTRHLVLGNENLLVCIDKNARIRDLYYPHIGQENHVSSNAHYLGVWIDGEFSRVSLDDWHLSIKYKKDSLVGETIAENHRLKVKLKINEAVHHEKNIFLKKVEVENLLDKKREVRVFFSQHFHISENNIGDTVYYNPILESLINYKGKRYFLIGGMHEGKPFTDYATGVAGNNGKEGTYVDAEDGVLGKNPVEHGTVDSTIGFSVNLEAGEKKEIDYWICVGKKYSEIGELRNFVLNQTLNKLIKETEKYWVKWANQKISFKDKDEKILDLFKRSLLIVKAQTNSNGAIIAANDTHTFHFKKDTYSYMWPRDGALIARSLDKVGHKDITTKFFEFCSDAITKKGFLLHKYRPDGSLGSSWHSWLKGDKLQYPIQEDETALVLDALWKHYLRHEDVEMIKGMYKNFIKRAGDFLVEYRDEKTKLPKESYDLWEEKLGVHTFTCSTVYAGLEAAKNLAERFGTKKDAKIYEKAAKEIQEATMKYMYDEERKIFIKGVYSDKEGKMKKDYTIDSSTFYGLFEYRLIGIDDERLTRTIEETLKKLWCIEKAGGMCRYENDMYHRTHSSPNPWIITTMWLAEYYIAKAKTKKELVPAEDLLKWVTEKALPSGSLSEQIHPVTSETISVAPLTWSHAGFIIAAIKYFGKLKKLKS